MDSLSFSSGKNSINGSATRAGRSWVVNELSGILQIRVFNSIWSDFSFIIKFGEWTGGVGKLLSKEWLEGDRQVVVWTLEALYNRSDCQTGRSSAELFNHSLIG